MNEASEHDNRMLRRVAESLAEKPRMKTGMKYGCRFCNKSFFNHELRVEHEVDKHGRPARVINQ